MSKYEGTIDYSKSILLTKKQRARFSKNEIVRDPELVKYAETLN